MEDCALPCAGGSDWDKRKLLAANGRLCHQAAQGQDINDGAMLVVGGGASSAGRGYCGGAGVKGKLERIVINDLREHTFFSQLIIRRDGQRLEIDSRPSDAIAIGIAENVPIFVAEHVLEQVTGDTPG